MKFELLEEVIEGESSTLSQGVYKRTSSLSLSRYLFKGRWQVGNSEGEEVPFNCASYVREEVKDWERAEEVLSTFLQEGVKVKSKKVTRRITYRGNVCEEVKVVNYVKVGEESFGFTGSPKDVKSVIEFLKLVPSLPQGRPRFMESANVILDPEATAKLFHVILHLMREDSSFFNKGEKLFGEVTVYDNPKNSFSVGFSTFDDEGTRTEAKELIGDGYVVNYMGSVATGTPGNGRGALPKPDYFTVELKRGDWKVNELLEETKDGILVLGTNYVEVVKNSVRLFPRTAVLVGSGKVFLREVVIRFMDLASIDVVTSDVKNVMVDEEHGGLTPFVGLTAKPLFF
ncbi:MAG: metallopeptidase TldD-related protein [Candidatus Aramenus sulfurataquae]|uniref:Metallopeptidase TldD-related protein n=2 Tax=Candidatus Aramenus sulfurataquae TaxID=1326980 RepID=A0A0F2LQ64_9CREN|nr:metallopeptidase TldD-related protein [Candidatus Aramenus sulfurataquae]